MQTSSQSKLNSDKTEQIAKEYEDFAYIVSHDLSAPLRHVKEFTRLLIDERKKDITDQEQQYVEFLEKSLHRLEGMQKALLVFSRLNTRAGPLRETNFNSAFAAALKKLDETIQTQGAIIECGDLPCMVAEPGQIELLFFNLIDNALKFHKRNAAKIEISVTAIDRGADWLFEIRDNGIGIAEKYHKEIFRMFRRLDPENFPGTGAGLTIARKIVRRHGGEVQIESEENKGTSVFFSIVKS